MKPAVLTAAGGQVLEHCRRVLAAVAELEACSSNAADPAGDLQAWRGPWPRRNRHGTTLLDVLRRAFPRIKLHISSSWSTDLIEEVRNGLLDRVIGLLTDAHTVPSGLARIPLGAEQVVIIGAAKSVPKRGGNRYRLRDLAGQGWFLNTPGCGCRAALVRSFDRLQLPIHIAAEVFGEDLQLSLLANSGGLGLVPRRQFEAQSTPARVADIGRGGFRQCRRPWR